MEETEDGLTELFDDILDIDLLDGLFGNEGDLGQYIHESNLPVNTNRIVASDTITDSVDGASARGTTNLQHGSDFLSENYRIQLTVVDDANRTTSESKLCDAEEDACQIEA